MTLKSVMKSSPNIRWLVLDAMGVIFKVGNDVDDLLIPFLRRIDPAVSARKVNRLYDLASVGKMTSRQFWERLGFGVLYPIIEKSHLDANLTLDPGLKKILPRLKRRFSLAMLSNDIAEWSRYLRAKHGLDRHLKTAIVSGDVRCGKPDPRIFRVLLKRIRAKADECVFVDDKAKNLRQARRMGFKTVQFLRNDPREVYDRGADGHIRSFKELPLVLEKLKWPYGIASD